MEYLYYRDSRHHYLTIPCPEMENYQYRMLAANRMESLIPCSIRNVDGRRHLYYDITARENMTEFFRGHGSAAQEIPRLLYAIADAGVTMERYLLDSSRLLLGPEFVFYDYTRGEFSFLYYPEDQENPSGPTFYEYLADRADPQDKMLYYTLLRLISISANRTFVLEEGFLTRALGRGRPQEEPLTGEQEAMQAVGTNIGSTMAASGTESRYPARGRAAYDRTSFIDAAYGQMRESAYPPDGDMDHQMPGQRGTADPEDPDEPDIVAAEGERQMNGRRLVLFVVAAALFLAGAIGLACARLYVPMEEDYELAARYGMIACLTVSILIGVYGAYSGLRSSRQELRSVRDQARWERRNALTPVDDFH